MQVASGALNVQMLILRAVRLLRLRGEAGNRRSRAEYRGYNSPKHE
jgi:hypothetical protein